MTFKLMKLAEFISKDFPREAWIELNNCIIQKWMDILQNKISVVIPDLNFESALSIGESVYVEIQKFRNLLSVAHCTDTIEELQRIN